MNISLTANVSSLPRLESDLYEPVVDKDGHYGGVTADERWAQEIKRLARERNAVIPAHNYQLPEIQDIADYTSDSFGLPRITMETDANVIVFCGVHFIVETARVLSPEKTVLTPDEHAGCSLADPITAGELAERKAENPGALVVSHANTTADAKALTDICCTSFNAVDMVRPIPEDQEILFNPDQFLGAHVRRGTGCDNIKVWAGEYYVHANINGKKLTHRMEENIDSQLFIHPKCGRANSVVYLAGKSTIEPERVQTLSIDKMLTEAQKLEENKPNDKVLVVTEAGMLHQLRKIVPDVDLEPVNDRAPCPYMKLITPAALLRCLVEGADEVDVGLDIIDRACASVECMIAIGNPGGGE